MSDETARLKLAQLVSLQELNAVTWNEALAQIDALVDLCLNGQFVDTPPANPQDGDAYITGAAPTGDWSGYPGKIAACLDGAWRFYAPFKGLIAFAPSVPDFLAFNGTAWVSLSSLLAMQNLAMLGINAAADAINKLAVASSSVLFNHIGNGVQAKLNKNTTADTASLLYQTGWSGRAEIGLCGDDNFHFKISADGTSWRDAIFCNAANGRIGLNTTNPLVPLHLHVDGSPAVSSLITTDDLAITKESNSANFSGTVAADVAARRMVFKAIRARGSLAAPTVPLPGDYCFSLLGAIFDGTMTRATAGIEMFVDGTVSSGVAPQRVCFYSGSSSSRTERARINATGEVGIGKTATSGILLDVSGPIGSKSYTVATVPSAAVQAGQIIYVSDESGGAVLAFSDGTNWRRVTDRAVVS